MTCFDAKGQRRKFFPVKMILVWSITEEVIWCTASFNAAKGPIECDGHNSRYFIGCDSGASGSGRLLAVKSVPPMHIRRIRNSIARF